MEMLQAGITRLLMPTGVKKLDKAVVILHYTLMDSIFTSIPINDGVVKTSIYCVVCPVAILDILHV